MEMSVPKPEGSRYAFNINHYVYVKLKPPGIKRIIDKYGVGYYEHCVKAYEEPDGYTAIQMHTFMTLFGDMLWLGLRPDEMPFETTVYFKGSDLDELY